jgi:hypothetical protein
MSDIITRPVGVGSRVIDSLPFSQGGSVQQAMDLRADGVEVLVGYLGVITDDILGHALDAGLAFMPVTLAGAWDGASAVARCKGLGLPAGITVWCDLEGDHAFVAGAGVIPKLAAWAQAIAAAGYMPGLYVGVPQPLTSEELFSLPFVRYWRGQGSIRDRHNALAEPKCGWCMTQAYPQHMRRGVLVDDDMVSQDYFGRVPVAACRSASFSADTLPEMPTASAA